MKVILLLFMITTPIYSSFDAYYHTPNHPDIRPQFSLQRSPEMDDLYSLRHIQSPISPEEVHVVELQTHAQETVALSKKKIACLVAASAITSAILTATVTLTIHFSSCK